MMEHEDVDVHLDEGSGNILRSLAGAPVADQTRKTRGSITGSRKAGHYPQHL